MDVSGRQIDPFGGKPPSVPVDYGAVPVNAPESPPPGRFEPMGGLHARYRLAFVAMDVPGLPVPLRIGQVSIRQQDGPIWTQHTYIKQRPGWRPHFDKTMHQSYLVVGDGLSLTLAELPVTIPTDEHMAQSMSRWRDEVLAAVSIVVALLDERIAQEELLEDVVVSDPGDPRTNASADIARRVRHFLPLKRFLSRQRETFKALESIDLSEDQSVFPAARWYLRACHAGPTPDAIVFLSIALEALAPPLNKNDRRTDVMRIEAALQEAGAPLEELDLSVGRLAGLRGDVVHTGMEQPNLLNRGYYQLEILVRLLLRHRLSIKNGVWPLSPDQGTLRPHLQTLERWLVDRAKTTIRRVDDSGPSSEASVDLD